MRLPSSFASWSLLITIALTGCGGGEDPPPAALAADAPLSTSNTTHAAVLATEAAPVPKAGGAVAADEHDTSLPAPSPASEEAVDEVSPVGRAFALGIPSQSVANGSGTPALVGANKVTSLASLTDPNPVPGSTTLGVGYTSGCRRGYVPPLALRHTSPTALPATTGTFYSMAELGNWKLRVLRGPFKLANDYTPGSPGDWDRISKNARQFLLVGEAAINSASSSLQTHGTLARDAAFSQLVLPDANTRELVRAYLLRQAANPAMDFAQTLCITNNNGETSDAWFGPANWLLRYLVTYDFVRPALTAIDRLAIENFIRRNAYFLMAHNDWGLATLFPERTAGRYATKASAAAATTPNGIYWAKRYDTNDDCSINSRDLPSPYYSYAYVRADRSLGPRITVVSQFYNNRRSIAVAAFGAAGVLLSDPELISSAKRYVMEWLTYSVWGDGSHGEFARNNDYCVPQQGLIYGATNLQTATLLSTLLARQGDYSVPNFKTVDGLFGTQSPNTPKSVSTVLATHFQIATGKTIWYLHEGWRWSQSPRDATLLNKSAIAS